MANTIRIKRRSSDSTAPTTAQVVNGELALNENNDILYYGKGGNSSASSSVLKIGGSGAFLTMDTNQTPTGVKTFSTTTLLITGGSNGNVLTTNGSGTLSWSSVSANAFSSITDGTNTAAASGGDTLKLRSSGALSIVVANNDPTHGDNALFTVTAGSTSTAGAVQLTDSTSSTSTTTAATPNSVKSAYDLANAALPKSGGTMTGAITLAADPSSALHAATKQYVDSVSQGLDVKQSVRLASTGTNISVTYTATGGSSGRGQITNVTNVLDSVNLAANDRILLKDQTTGAQNGIWVVSTLGTGANGVWDRATDFDSDADVTAGAFTFVEEGTTNADSGFVLSTNSPIVIGGASGTSLTWTQFSGAGQITAGNGLTKTGNTLDVGGTANRITVAADSVDIASTYVGQASITTLGTVATGTWDATTIATTRGGTGLTSFTTNGAVYATSTSALTTGTLPLASGGTGQTTAQSAMNAFAGATTSGSYLRGDGTNVVMSTIQVADVPTLNQSTTGSAATLTTSRDFLTNLASTSAAGFNGSANNTHGVTGTLPVANGGTGATTFTANGILYGNTTSAVGVTTAGTVDGAGIGQLLTVNSSNVPIWTNTIDGGGY